MVPVICVGPIHLFNDKGRRLSRNEPVQSEHLTWHSLALALRSGKNVTWKPRDAVNKNKMNEKQRTATREYWADQARRERKRAETKARWANPEERRKLMVARGAAVRARPTQRTTAGNFGRGRLGG